MHSLTMIVVFINYAQEFGQTPLDTASFDGHLDVVQTLVDGGANVNVTRKVSLFPHLGACTLSDIILTP